MVRGGEAEMESGSGASPEGVRASRPTERSRWVTVLLAALVLAAAACGEDTATGLAETRADGTTGSETSGSGEPPTVDQTTTTAVATTPTEATPTTQPPLTASGVAFASAIDAGGKAIDPGTEFPADVSRVYAVFRADTLPRGLELDVDEPHPDGYYAYLRLAPSSNLSTFGWRWFHNSNLVVEYEADAAASEFFWLERFDRSEVGMFGAPSATGMGPGRYVVEFTVSGNALFEESFTIVP